MVVSHMRDHELTPRRRRKATRIVDAAALTSDLWVTEMQNGCTVLIVDWGNGRYSLTHLQPYMDEQFTLVGRAVMGLGGYTRRVTGEAFFKNVYKNQWLKKEMTDMVTATGGTPQYYIMVQSMFESSRRRTAQVIGVRRENRFTFYRQSKRARDYQVTELKWSGWYSWLPYFTY
jgi:hypothetical protein